MLPAGSAMPGRPGAARQFRARPGDAGGENRVQRAVREPPHRDAFRGQVLDGVIGVDAVYSVIRPGEPAERKYEGFRGGFGVPRCHRDAANRRVPGGRHGSLRQALGNDVRPSWPHRRAIPAFLSHLEEYFVRDGLMRA
jgi:hypothetical protein